MRSPSSKPPTRAGCFRRSTSRRSRRPSRSPRSSTKRTTPSRTAPWSPTLRVRPPASTPSSSRPRRRCPRISWRSRSATSSATPAAPTGSRCGSAATPDKKQLTGFALESTQKIVEYLQPLLLDQVSVQEARHRRGPGFRRRRDGEHRGDLLSRDAAARGARRVGRASARTSPRCSRTKSRISGSATW